MNRAEALKELSEMQTESWTDTRQREAVELAIEVLEQEPTKEEKALLQKWRDNRGISLDDFAEALETLKEEPMDAIAKIRADIEKAKDDFNEYNDYQIGVRQGFRFALEIIDNHISRKEQE